MNTKTDKTPFINRKTHFVMSEKMHDFLIGTLLGNGNLSSSQKGENWSYRCLHGIQAREYLFHKYSLFQDCCLTGPCFQEFKGVTGKK